MNIRNFAAAVIIASVAATPALAEDLEFLLINESSGSLTEFYVSPASTGSWESNLLRGGYLDASYEVDVLIADGLSTCIYDILAVFSDGERLEDYDLDLCELGSYTFE